MRHREAAKEVDDVMRREKKRPIARAVLLQQLLQHSGLTQQRPVIEKARGGDGDLETVSERITELQRPALVFELGIRLQGQRVDQCRDDVRIRSEEHTSELQSLMRISYAVFCLKKKRLNT